MDNSLNLSKTSRKQEVFARVLLEAINEGLQSLGEGSKKAVNWYLGIDTPLLDGDFYKNLEVLIERLERTLGIGANILETMIIRSLYTKLGLTFEEKASYTFMDYVREAREDIR